MSFLNKMKKGLDAAHSAVSKATADKIKDVTVDAKHVLDLFFDTRKAKGWEPNYDSKVKSAEGTRRRAEAEKAAIESMCISEHARLKKEAGWKKDYGMKTSKDVANNLRAEAVRKADAAVSQTRKFMDMFFRKRADQGWKESYGSFCSAAKGQTNRAAAEAKAQDYLRSL